jgi:sugar-specific transcriptional regulator TrmB
MSESNFDDVVFFKKSTIKILKEEFNKLKEDIENNKEFYENCLKNEFQKNSKLKKILNDISNNLFYFITDSENQLLYIEKITKKNKKLEVEIEKLNNKNVLLEEELFKKEKRIDIVIEEINNKNKLLEKEIYNKENIINNIIFAFIYIILFVIFNTIFIYYINNK